MEMELKRRDRRPAARAEPFRRPVPETVPSRAPKRRAVAPSCRGLRPAERRRETPDIPTPDRPRRHSAAPTGRPTNKIGTRSACPRAQPARSRGVLALAIAHGGGPSRPQAHSETPYARSIVPFSYASVIAPTLIITRTLIEQSKTHRQGERSVSASLFAPSATTAASDGSSRPPPHSGGRRPSRSSTAGVC